MLLSSVEQSSKIEHDVLSPEGSGGNRCCKESLTIRVVYESKYYTTT